MYKTAREDAGRLPLAEDHIDIVTDRLRLTPLRVDYRDSVVELLNNSEVSRNLTRVPLPYRGAHFDAFFAERTRPPREIRLAITDWRQDKLLGMIGLRGSPAGVNDISEAPELGYWLGQPYWGRGLMKEAAAALLDHIFMVSEHPIVTAGYFTDNPASGNVLTFLGFVETGRSKIHSLARNEEVDRIEMELTRARYFGTGMRDDGEWHRSQSDAVRYSMNY